MMGGGRGALDLEDSVSGRDEHESVPKEPRGLALRGRSHHRTEEGIAADTDHRGPDIGADLIERLVMGSLDDLVEVGAGGGVAQRGVQADLGQGLRNHAGIVPTALDVQAGADRRVEAPQDLITGGLGGRRADSYRTPRLAHPFQVFVGETLSLVLGEVEIGQGHDPPLGLHRSDGLDFAHPA